MGFCIAPPASAYLSQVATELAPWIASLGINIEPYIEELEEVESFYAQVVNRDVDDILPGLKWALGKMGLPIAGEIPVEIQSAVAQVLADAGIYTPNSQKLESVLMGEANKKYADAQAEFLLGQEGQQEVQDALSNNAKLVAANSNSAQLVGSMTVSQDILREQARIDANSSVLLGSIYEELVLSRINSTWDNQQGAVLAADVERKNWESEVAKTSHQAYVMRSTAEAFGYGLNSTDTIP